ncbi:MAG: nuclear transport factor 2 family protein [Geodermatophilaceae bacterium]|nr:nuclear transport factor 2 family protein [Geodermatophilaceae bacterium]
MQKTQEFHDQPTQEFLETVLPRVLEADTALHNGDPRGRIALWSRTEPLTVFGALLTARGWGQIRLAFEQLGERFSQCTSAENEVIAAGTSGDLGYTVAFEHTSTSINGSPRSYTLRVTTIFRREQGTWKAVHRHADEVRQDPS